MDAPETLTLTNICGGAVKEVFDREVAELLKNISDPNTDAEKKRTVILEFHFNPFPDRSGAVVEFACKSKLPGVDTVKGNVFFSRQSGTYKAYARDPKQTALFAAQPPATPAEQ